MALCPNCGENNSDTARFCQSCGQSLAPAPTQEAAQIPVPHEARKTATMVFCDLTGSTALGEKMDPESLRRVITRYFNEMKQVLIRHGGTVEKFIGDAVMAVFGVPLLHEDDALRAVRAADEMQKKMREMNVDLELEWGVGLRARIGVNTGEVIAGDASQGHGFVSGDAVNVTARLEQAAPPGEVLIGEPTHRLVRDAVKVESVEPLELKGKSERVPAYRLVEVLTNVLGVSRHLDSPLVGRGRELALLKETFEKSNAQSTCQLATVFGMAGSGKSRLTAEFIRYVQDTVRVVRGRCLPYGEGITFWPIAEAIRELCDITEDDSAEVARGKLAAAVGDNEEADLIVERVATAMGLSESTAGAQETFWAIRKLLEAAARAKPVLVVLDDIHWAETTMLDLIEYMAGFIQVPMLILCLSRRDLLDTRPSWGSGFTTILLEPLNDQEIKQLIDNFLGKGSLPDRMVKSITEAAEGHPLYVEEIIRMLIDDAMLHREGDRWVPKQDLTNFKIPPTINALVSARLDRLTPDEQAVIQRGSIIGKTFWWGAVSELSPDLLRARIAHFLQALVRKELILPDRSTFVGEDAFRFAHIMLRDTAYNGMPKEIRAELHEKFGHWLEGKAGDRLREYQEILGYHLEQAYKLREELGSLDEKGERLRARAADLLGDAGDRAFARSDMPAAANLLGRAAALLPLREARRMQLSIDQAEALIQVGDLDLAGTVIEQVARAAEATGEKALGARAALQRIALRHWLEVEGWPAETLNETARLIPVLEAAGDQLGLAHAHYLVATAYWDDYRLADAEGALERSLEHAGQAGREAEISKILGSLTAVLLLGPHSVEDAITRCEKIIELAKHDHFVQGKSLLRLAGLRAMNGDFDDARDLVAQARSILADLGAALELAASTHEAGMVETLVGDQVAAEKEFLAGFEILKQMGEQAYLASSAAYLSRSLYAQERFDEAYEFSRISEEAAGGDEVERIGWGPTRAKILARRGEMEEAERLARDVVKLVSDTDDVLDRSHALMGLAEVILLAGRLDEAIPLMQESLGLYEKKGVKPLAEKVRSVLEQLGGVAQ